MRASKRWRIALLSILGVVALLGFVSRKYVWLHLSRRPAPLPIPASPIANPAVWNNPKILLIEANQLSWVWNWPRAEPLYARAEKLFKKEGDQRDEIYSRIGLIRAQSQQGMSFVEVSARLGKLLENPVMTIHPRLKLWCLAAKGYTDIEINPASCEQDWLEVRKIAKRFGEAQWAARATGELGTIAFLRGDSRKAGAMVGSALLSAMRTGDEGEEVRSLEMLGNGFYEVERYAEAVYFFDRAIAVAASTPDAGFPYMAYEGKSQTLIRQNRLNQAREVLGEALAVAKKERDFGHEAHLLNICGDLDLRVGDRQEAMEDLREGSDLALKYKFYRTAGEGLFHLSELYIADGNLKLAEATATLGLDASRRVGDRYFLPRDLTMLADFKAREGHVVQANALYEQAEDVIDGMLVNLDEPYWSSSLAAAMSMTYLHHFELLAKTGNIPEAFEVLERVRGRTAAALLENRVSFRADKSPGAQALDGAVSALQLQLMQATNEKERERLKLELFGYERELAWTEGDHGVSDRDWLEEPAPLKEVQSVLHPGELVLEYVLGEPHAYCLWVTRNRVGLTALPTGRNKIEKLTRVYIASIRSKGSDTGLAKELYSLLIAPVPAEATHDQFIVVPDGALYFLPFDTLRDPSGKFLLESHTLSYVPAATVLTILRSAKDMKQAPRSLLAVGDVPYKDQGDVAALLPKPQSFETEVMRGISNLLGTGFSDLPETREEVTCPPFLVHS